MTPSAPLRSTRLLGAVLGLGLVAAWLACGNGVASPGPDRGAEWTAAPGSWPPESGFAVWESNRTGDWRIWVRVFDNTPPGRLSPEEDGLQHCCPHVSPDGSRLVYLSRAGGRDEYPEVEVPGELRLVDLASGTERTLVPEARNYGWGNRAAVWRSDRELIYIRADGRTFLLDLDRGSSRALTTEPRESLGWLIDATLSYATSAAPTFSPYDAEARRVVERTELSGCEPYFSHDGRWGFWAPGAGGPVERIELASRERSNILEKDDPRLGEKRYVYFPMISRDGRRLAFGASDGDHSHFEADYDVFVVPTDPATLEVQGPPVRVTAHPATDRYPDVFPPRSDPRGAGGSARERAGGRDRSASWPATREGLVFLWRIGNSPNLVHDPELGAARAFNLEARGRARLDHSWAMVLDGGAQVAPGEAAENLLQAVRRTGELTLEATVTPAEAAPDGLRSIVGFSPPGGEPNLALGQDGRHLVALLRTDAPDAPSAVRLFEVTPGDTVHVAITYDGGRLTAFRDGERILDGRRLPGSSLHWTPGELRLGSAPGGGGAWHGTLEGVALYARALDPETVRESAARYRGLLEARPEVPSTTVRARLLERSEIPTLRQISPYRQALAVHRYRVLGPPGHELEGRGIRVARWVILDGETQPAARRGPGAVEELVIEPFEANRQLEGVYLSETVDGGAGEGLFYAVDASEPEGGHG